MKVKVEGVFYDFFSQVSYEKVLNNVASSFTLKCSFDPKSSLHRKLFKPLAYSSVEIYSDSDKLLLRGVIVNSKFKSSAKPEIATMTGYSLSGVLGDVNIPLDGYPLEKNELNFLEIIDSVIRLFNIKYSYSPSVKKEMNKVYEKTVATPTEKIGSYLSKLALQRNIVLSSKNDGSLYFYKVDIANLKVKASLNKSNTESADLTVKGQNIHSDITAIRQQTLPFLGFVEYEDKTTSGHVNNPIVDYYKPRVISLDDGGNEEVKTFSKAARASELKNITLSVSYNGFRDLYEGDLIDYINDEVFIYTRTSFLISGVKMSETGSVKKTILTLVLPEAFSDKKPIKIFEPADIRLAEFLDDNEPQVDTIQPFQNGTT